MNKFMMRSIARAGTVVGFLLWAGGVSAAHLELGPMGGWLGLRTDLRCHLMFTNSAVAASSGPSGGSVSFAGEVFAQGEVAGGLFIAFGGPREPSDTERPLQEFHQRESIPFE